MAIKAIAFDVHGTLGRWEWSQGTVIAYDVQQLLERFGIQISYQVFEAARQATFFLDTLKRPIHGWVDFLALTFARMELKISTDLLESIAAIYRDKNNFLWYEDAMPALEAIRRRGLVTCAFTTLPKFMLGKNAGPILSLLDHYFDPPAVGFAKGDKRFYVRIAELLGVAPQQIASVGDEVLCDCELPREAGWKPWHLCRDDPGLRVLTSHPIVKSLGEFEVVIQKEIG